MLSMFRIAIIRYKLGAVMAFFFLTVSCADEGAGGEKVIAKSVYAAADYFRAIYFIDGPAANMLGDYQQLSISSLTDDSNIIKEVRSFQDRVVEYIGEKHPTFFKEFNAQVTSGDYSVVKTAIKGGVHEYMEALQALSNEKVSATETSAMAKRYLAKYGAKRMSKSEFASSVKAFSKDVTDEKLSSGEKAADLVGSSRIVVTDYYYWVYVAAAVAVAVVLVVLWDAAPVDPPIDPIDPGTPIETEVSYLFDDYAATITAGMAIE